MTDPASASKTVRRARRSRLALLGLGEPGESERAAFGVAAHGPALAGVNDLAAEGMLGVFRDKAADLDGAELDLRAEDVMAMSVEPESYDAVISSMAMHWFPDKPGAAVAMARALKPGGVIGILCSGRGGEREFRDVLSRLDPPAPKEWDAAFDFVQRDVHEMEQYLTDAGLEPIDVWMERRRRATPPDAFMARTRAVAGHLLGNPPGGFSELDRRIEAALHEAAGPDGFVYDYCKLFAVARRPGAPAA